MPANTQSRVNTTQLFTFSNKKGEVIARVRATSLADAQYKAGINSQGETSNSNTNEVEAINTDAAGHHK